MTSVNTEENTFAQKTITTQEEIKLSENIYQSSASNSEENVATLDNVEVYKQEPNFKSKAEKLRFTVVIIGVILAMFMMSLNSTVVAPALSIIATDLNALSSQTWIATAYLVAVNSFQPLSGKFSDIFGRKSVFLFGISFFFIGSLINALSTNINMLIAGRTIQGFGGGGVMSIVFIVVTDITPYNLRPRFQSMLSVVYGIASVIGPLLGGAFVDHATWHWDFWFNVIIAGLAFIIIFVFLKETSTESGELSFKDKLRRIDWFGTLFSISFVVCLLLALNWGSTYGWSEGHSVGPFVAAGVSFIALIGVEGWVAKEPLLPGRVIFKPACLLVYLSVVMMGLTFVGTLYFGPIYYQSVFGADSTQSGLRLIPFMACLIGGSIGCSLLLRKIPNTKYYLVVGGASNLLGYGLFYMVNEHSTWGQQAGYLAFCGFAFGLSQQNAILTVQQSVEKRDIAVATSIVNFSMMLASSVGVAIYQVLFTTFLKDELAKVPADILYAANKYGALKNYLFIKTMPLELQIPVIHAYSEALHKVFILPIAASAIGFLLTLFFKNVRYGAQPPIQTAAPADEEKGSIVIIDEDKK